MSCFEPPELFLLQIFGDAYNCTNKVWNRACGLCKKPNPKKVLFQQAEISKDRKAKRLKSELPKDQKAERPKTDVFSEFSLWSDIFENRLRNTNYDPQL